MNTKQQVKWKLTRKAEVPEKIYISVILFSKNYLTWDRIRPAVVESQPVAA